MPSIGPKEDSFTTRTAVKEDTVKNNTGKMGSKNVTRGGRPINITDFFVKIGDWFKENLEDIKNFKNIKIKANQLNENILEFNKKLKKLSFCLAGLKIEAGNGIELKQTYDKEFKYNNNNFKSLKTQLEELKNLKQKVKNEENSKQTTLFKKLLIRFNIIKREETIGKNNYDSVINLSNTTIKYLCSQISKNQSKTNPSSAPLPKDAVQNIAQILEFAKLIGESLEQLEGETNSELKDLVNNLGEYLIDTTQKNPELLTQEFIGEHGKTLNELGINLAEISKDAKEKLESTKENEKPSIRKLEKQKNFLHQHKNLTEIIKETTKTIESKKQLISNTDSEISKKIIELTENEQNELSKQIDELKDRLKDFSSKTPQLLGVFRKKKGMDKLRDSWTNSHGQNPMSFILEWSEKENEFNRCRPPLGVDRGPWEKINIAINAFKKLNAAKTDTERNESVVKLNQAKKELEEEVKFLKETLRKTELELANYPKADLKSGQGYIENPINFANIKEEIVKIENKLNQLKEENAKIDTKIQELDRIMDQLDSQKASLKE